MTITREQVADLRAGDVVEMTDEYLCTIRGPLRLARAAGELMLGGITMVRYSDGGVPRPAWSLTVISRAPDPLYVNHDRTEPVPGDVVGPVDLGANDGQTWHFLDAIGKEWFDRRGYALGRDELPDRLRLLVDGATGETVPKFRSQGQVVQ